MGGGPLVHRLRTVVAWEYPILYEGKPVGTPDAGAFWRVIAQHKVKVLFTAPTAFRAIKKDDPTGALIRNYELSGFKALFLAGERCDPDTLCWAERQLRVPVIDHWWQTETGWPICANCLGIEQLPVKPGSPTKPVPGMDVRVVDPYGQPRWEPICLYADHTPLRLFPNLCAHAERDFGFSSEGERIECAELGVQLTNPFLFLRTEYPKRSAWLQLWYQGINHGDLNLRNVLVDEKENLYVIDFSETRPRNIVADFARMETILQIRNDARRYRRRPDPNDSI